MHDSPLATVPRLSLLITILFLSQPILASDYFPLEAGARSYYVVDSAALPEVTRTVTGTTNFLGHEVWDVEDLSPSSWRGNPRHHYYSITPEGAVLYHGSWNLSDGGTIEVRIEPPLQIVPAEVLVGVSWEHSVTYSLLIDGEHHPSSPFENTAIGQVVATDATLEVPAGVFDAALIDLQLISSRSPDENSRLESWYAQNTGLLREVVYGVDGIASVRELWDAPVESEATSWGRLKSLYH